MKKIIAILLVIVCMFSVASCSLFGNDEEDETTNPALKLYKDMLATSVPTQSVTVVELGKKGELSVETIPLVPKRDMVELKGKYDELCLKSFYENTTYRDDYVHITLTDEEDVVDAMGKLRTIYRNLMGIKYDNTRTRSSYSVEGASDVDNKSQFELFAELYELQNGKPMSDKQSQYITELIEKIWGDEQ